MKDYEFDTLLGNAQDLADSLKEFKVMLDGFQKRDNMFTEEEYKRISDKVKVIFDELDNYAYGLISQY